MAEGEPSGGGSEGGGGGKGLNLGPKVGPLPVGIWILLAGVVWFYIQRRNSSSSTATPGQQKDPAGNVGVIDPGTGYVYGSPEDQAALGAQDTQTGTTTGSGGSTTAGQYTDNTSWERAAINYLVAQGVDPTAANSAIGQYLAAQPLTPQQQAQVNLVIQAIGAPPQPPNPGTAPPPIVNPPGTGTVYADNPPSGLTVTDKSANSISLRWNASTNATGYTVSYQTGSAQQQSTTVTGTSTSTTLTGLQAASLYTINVQATPAKSGAGSASITATTTSAPSGGGTPPPPPSGGAGNPAHLTVIADGRTSLNAYAQRYNVSLAFLINRINPSQAEDAQHNPNSPLYKYMHAHAWNNPVPAGTPVEITT